MAKTATNPGVSLNMPSVTTNEMARMIHDVFMLGYNTPKGQKKQYLPLHFVGMPGIGKTAGFVQACLMIGESTKRRFVHQPTAEDYLDNPEKKLFGNDIRISQMSSLDVRGLVARSKHDENRMTWLAPEWLPSGANVVGLNFFDEIQLGRPEVQAAAYQIINERMVGNLRLAEDVMQLAASNPIAAGGLNYGIPPALANRFMHVEVVSDPESFIEWGQNHGIHPFVRAYIGFQSADLLAFPKDNPDMLSWASPRTWEMVSTAINIATTSIRNKLINAAIGAEIAAKFIAYLEETAQLPDPKEILINGKMHYPDRRDLVYAMLESVLSAVENDKKQIGNFINWVLGKEVSADLQAYAFKMCMQSGKNYIVRDSAFLQQMQKNPRLSALIVNVR